VFGTRTIEPAVTTIGRLQTSYVSSALTLYYGTTF